MTSELPGYSHGTGIKKALVEAVATALSVLAATYGFNLGGAELQVDQLAVFVVSALVGAVRYLRNLAKVRWGWSWLP